jgi:hypothetical protein
VVDSADGLSLRRLASSLLLRSNEVHSRVTIYNHVLCI